MAEKRLELKAGQRVMVRGPDAPGPYQTLPRIDLKSGDVAIVSYGTVAEPAPEPPPPDPEPALGPSGIAVRPVKDGWIRRAFSHFDADIPLGQWTGDPDGLFQPRPDAARDGQYKDSSGRAIYSAKRCISQHDSLLDCKLFQDSSGQRYTGCPISKEFYASIRATEVSKADHPEDGWKCAHLVAVGGTNVSSRGEYDMPECKFSSSPQVNAFMHKVGGAQVAFNLAQALGYPGAIYEWHEYTIEVVSGKWVDYFVDGKLLVNESGSTKLVDPAGRHSVTDGVTTELVHWVLQNETFLGGQSIPAQMGEMHVLTDWAAIDVLA